MMTGGSEHAKVEKKVVLRDVWEERQCRLFESACLFTVCQTVSAYFGLLYHSSTHLGQKVVTPNEPSCHAETLSILGRGGERE